MSSLGSKYYISVSYIITMSQAYLLKVEKNFEKNCDNYKSDRSLIKKLEKSLNDKLDSSLISKTENIVSRLDSYLNSKNRRTIENNFRREVYPNEIQDRNMSQDKRRIKEVWNKRFHV